MGLLSSKVTQKSASKPLSLHSSTSTTSKTLNELQKRVLKIWLNDWELLRPSNSIQNRWTKDLTSILTKYIQIFHEFDIESSGNNLKFDSPSIVSNNKKGGIAIGNEVLTHGKYRFKFRVLQCNGTNGWDLAIGIVDTNKINGYKDRTCAFNSAGYFYWSLQATKVEYYGDVCMDYGIECKINYIIEMIVDIKCKTIEYVVNGIYCGIAFDGFKDGKYKMAVTFSGKENKIELL